MTILSPPPFRIYLMRHAEALRATRGEGDFERQLSDAGYVQAEIVANKAAIEGYRPDLVIASTARRCRQTTKAFQSAFGGTVEFRYSDALYNASANAYLDIIASQASVSSLMLLGHSPTVEQTLVALVGAEAVMAATGDAYPTAGFAVVDARQASIFSPARWLLKDFLTA
jgi:phosphohistidine phosphatase